MPPRCQGTLFIPKTPEKHPRKNAGSQDSAKNIWETLFSRGTMDQRSSERSNQGYKDSAWDPQSRAISQDNLDLRWSIQTKSGKSRKYTEITSNNKLI